MPQSHCIARDHARVFGARHRRDHQIERRCRPAGALAGSKNVGIGGGVCIERKDAPVELLREYGACCCLQRRTAAAFRRRLCSLTPPFEGTTQFRPPFALMP